MPTVKREASNTVLVMQTTPPPQGLEMRERIQKQQQQQDHRLRPQRSGLRAEPVTP